MKLRVLSALIGSFSMTLATGTAQAAGAGSAVVQVPPVIQFSNVALDASGSPLNGTVEMTFALYCSARGGEPLWSEAQNVRVDDSGQYTVYLGITKDNGLPASIFTTGQARWLGVKIAKQEEEPRIYLVSVPYAMKAGDAATVGGLPPSAFVLANASAADASDAEPNPYSVLPSSPVTSTGGEANTVPLFTGPLSIQDSAIAQRGSGASAMIGIGTRSPAALLDVNGDALIRGPLSLPALGTATQGAGYNSHPLEFTTSVFQSGLHGAGTEPETFQWQAEALHNGTSEARSSLNLLFGSNENAPTETGLSISRNGVITFAPGQTFPGSSTGGAITGVTAGTGLKGGGTTGSVKLSVDPAQVPLLNKASTGDLTLSGNVSSGGNVDAANFSIGGNAFAFGSFANGDAFLGFAGNPATVSSGGAGNNNTAIGWSALFSNSNGADNAAFGWGALGGNKDGSFNTASGYNALAANGGGSYNTASGFGALKNNAGTAGGQGSFNTATGSTSLLSNTTGSDNTAIGANALMSNNTGSDNTASGLKALFSNSTGGANTANGGGALYNNTIGSFNTAVGDFAGYYVSSPNQTGGEENTFLGYFSGIDSVNAAKLTSGLVNSTAIGAFADVTENNALVLGSVSGVNGCTSPCASVNVGIGTASPGATLDVEAPSGSTATINFGSASNPAALTVNGATTFTGNVTFAPGQTFPSNSTITSVTGTNGITATNNTGAVSLALTANSCAAGTALTALPFTCAPFASGGANNFNGNQNITGTLSVSGEISSGGVVNAATGFEMGGASFISTANSNTVVGLDAANATSGSYNTAVGTSALRVNGGTDNTATGSSALYENTGGSWNTADGAQALRANTSGTDNTAVGQAALQDNDTGNGNTAIGVQALLTTNQDDTNGDGSYNTGAGYFALNSNIYGNYNSAFGAWAGYEVEPAAANSGGSYNSAFGAYAGPDQSTQDLTNSTAIGAYADVRESNALVLGSIKGVNSAPASASVGIGTPTPGATLDVEAPSGAAAPTINFGSTTNPAQLTVNGTANFTGLVTFASGQTFPGAGGGSVAAGTGLSSSSSNGVLTLNNSGILGLTGGVGVLVTSGQTPVITLNTSLVPLLNTTSNGSLTVSGNLSADGTVNAASFSLGGTVFADGDAGFGNAFFGFPANSSTTVTGRNNTAGGFDALSSITSGSDNTASGINAGLALDDSNITGSWNSLFGADTVLSTGDLNNASAIGARAAVSASNAVVLGSISGVNGCASPCASVNVGIGTASPYSTLDVIGGLIHVGGTTTPATANQGAYIGWNDLTGGTGETDFVNNQGGGTGGFAFMNTPSEGTPRTTLMFISGGGDVGIGITSPSHILTVGQGLGNAYADGWSTYSSRRFKTNIHPLTNALATVEQLQGVSYDLKATGKHEIGVIAEDVGKVVPEVVSYEANGKDAQGVDYSRLTALLIEAVKQQQKQIAAQRRQIARLIGRLGELETALRTAGRSPDSNRSTGSVLDLSTPAARGAHACRRASSRGKKRSASTGKAAAHLVSIAANKP